MSTRKTLFLGIVISLSFQALLQSQTYASPELKQKEAAEMAAKLKRIQKDPEAYRAQGGNPEQVLKAIQAVEKPTPKMYEAPLDLARSELYKLVSIDAVDIETKHTALEMETFQADAASEFLKTNIVLDWENRLWYVIPRDQQVQAVEKRFQLEEGLIRIVDCPTCQDNRFSIVEQTENTLVLQFRPQDEGQFFVFALTFKK